MTTTKTSKSIAYCMSDMAPADDGSLPAGVVSVPAERGGCGAQHRAEVDDQGHPYIECDQCAPWLTGNAHGFASTPAGVPLTPDEMGEVEISKRQGEVSYTLAMKAMGQTMGQLIQQGGGRNTPAPAPQLSLAEQVAAMTPADRAALADLLNPGPPPPPAEPIAPQPADVEDAEPRTAVHPVAGPPAAKPSSRSRAPRGA